MPRTGQRLEQSQRQILAPILQQNIQIFLLNTVDLFQEINHRLDENPFLEMEADGNRNLEIDEFMDYRVKKQDIPEPVEDDMDAFTKNIYEDSSLIPASRQKSNDYTGEDTKQSFLENTITSKQSLYDDLRAQMKMMSFGTREEEIADIIISCIDRFGILRTSTDDIARFTNASTQEVEAVIKKVQTMEPPGIGARNSKEYIFLQIEKIFGKDSVYYLVAEEYFNLFEEQNEAMETLSGESKKDQALLREIQYNAAKLRRKLSKDVAASLNLRPEDVDDIMQRIEREINPYPQLDDNQEDDFAFVVPDIIVTVNPETYSIDVKVFDDFLPKIKLNNQYKTILKKKRGEELAENIKDLRLKYEEAKNFVHLIKRRSNTLYNLTQHLVQVQKEYFIKGSEYIKPLSIKEMAEHLEVHESTVSRIVNNKYIATPFGVYPLKYLFSHHVGSNEPEVSAKRIGELIKKVIEKEGGIKKLSDSKIEKILGNMGINISRRTVAKYRKKMNIHSSFDR
ncbi:MAG: RNA polymerase sigma-54 factor [Spirochaetae bacterium HGW-Spirochaetae-6]|nr:MAG: RNA polymerase sigma-54 factor [Spirochaetae bacterium HGW-Spirochaetae-6]